MGLFGKVPSISVSFGSKQGHSSTSLDRFPTADSVASSVSSEGRGRSLKKLGHNFSHLFSRSRSPSPAAFGSSSSVGRLPVSRSSSDGIDKLPRTDSLDAAETDADSVCDITPNNAFDSETETEAAEDEEAEDDDVDGGDDWLDLTKQHEPGGRIVNDELEGLFDPDDPERQVIAANTEANSSQITPLEFLQSQADQAPQPFAGQAPNLTRPPPEDHPFAAITAIATAAAAPRRVGPPKRSNTARSERSVGLDVGRPIYERNRCTIVVSHGDQAKAAQEARKPRFYFVASDLSEESRYALEWCIGTCMRQGDEVRLLFSFNPSTCSLVRSASS